MVGVVMQMEKMENNMKEKVGYKKEYSPFNWPTIIMYQPYPYSSLVWRMTCKDGLILNSNPLCKPYKHS